MSQTISISGRSIGTGHPAYIIAELSANHRGQYEHAAELVRAAHAAGADAVKLQTYTADTLTIDCDAPPFQIGSGTIWEGRSLYDLYQEAAMPWEWQPRLRELAQSLGLHFFSTPFDDTSVDFLEKMNVCAHKIASFEIVDHELIRKIASTGKPVIMSTGMASMAEIDDAVRVFRAAGGKELALLKCTSAYPAPAEEMNLKTIPHLAEAFGAPVGLSDHTMGSTAAIVAVSLGGSIVEKHLTMRRSDGGPDAAFSMEPKEFGEMVTAIRTTEKALGSVSYEVSAKEQATRVFRRSLFVVQDLKKGERFDATNVRSIRPGHGLPVKYFRQVLGRLAAHDITRGTPLEWGMIAGSL